MSDINIERMRCGECDEPFEVGMDIDNEEIVFVCGCDGALPKDTFIEGMMEQYGSEDETDPRGMFR